MVNKIIQAISKIPSGVGDACFAIAGVVAYWNIVSQLKEINEKLDRLKEHFAIWD